jgi:hypothetical protein
MINKSVALVYQMVQSSTDKINLGGRNHTKGKEKNRKVMVISNSVTRETLFETIRFEKRLERGEKNIPVR